MVRDNPATWGYTQGVRNVPPFTCAACGASPEPKQGCSRCGGAVVDAHGVAVLASVEVRPTRFGVVGSLGTWFTDRIARRRVEERAARAGPLRAIVDAPQGMARVRGRVRILRPVRAPDGTMLAAFRVRRLLDAREATQPTPNRAPMRRWIEDGHGCGSFLLDDGTGLALVDDDAFDVEAVDVDPLPAGADGMLAVREGDLAEVIGLATRGPAPAELAHDARVGSEPLLRFDGRPDARLLILPLPLTAVLPFRRMWARGSRTAAGPVTQEHEALSELEASGRAEAETRGPTTGSG